MESVTPTAFKHIFIHTLQSLILGVAGAGISAGVLAQIPADPTNYSRSMAFTYDQNSGLLLSETIEPDNPDLCMVTSYGYDKYGNQISRQVANCPGAVGVSVFETRSSHQTYAGQSVTLNSLSATVPEGSFPTLTSNALNQSDSRIFDPRFGIVTSMTGPDGLTNQRLLDEFGRPEREIRVDGSSTVYYYCFLPERVVELSANSANCPQPEANEIPSNAISFIHSEPRNTADIKNGSFLRIYEDAKGRKLRTVRQAFDANTQPGGSARLIIQDTDYNSAGLPVLATQPYFLDSQASTSEGNNQIGMRTSLYDAFARPVKIYHTNPQGSQAAIAFGQRGARRAAETTLTYHGLTTTITDDQGHTHVEENNINRKVARITDPLGAQLACQYDAFGNLIQTKDAQQNTISISYDIRGRKLSLDDPDTGLTTYGYNTLGELVQEHSPGHKALLTTMSYDRLGRMVERIDPEYASKWTYDVNEDGSSCGNGIGRLCESKTTHGISRRIVYDALGRAVNTLTIIKDGPSFSSAVSYDSTTGRIASQTYPTGLTVQYGYTSNGYLSSLSMLTAARIKPLKDPLPAAYLAPGSLLWQAQSYNAWGLLEQQDFGNHVSSQSRYDTVTGRLTADTAGIAGGQSVTNFQYAWNSLNQITVRTDLNGDGVTGAVTDAYTYDDVGRLQSYSVTSPTVPALQRNVSLRYNALGNILFKSDAGTYTYPEPGSSRPHAVQSVAGEINTSYLYDDNGNLTQSSAGDYRHFNYTSFNLPSSQTGIKGSKGTFDWQYDENHQRIKETRVGEHGTTTVWMLHPDKAGGLFFESEVTGSQTYNRHFLSVGGTPIGMLMSAGTLPTRPAGQTAPVQQNDMTLAKVEYWHKDYLGSLTATTDQIGAVTARYAYEPFGKRRKAGGDVDINGLLDIDWNENVEGGTRRGYTGHEHLDDAGLIHMNGRLYDPTLARFISADPMIQSPSNLQSYNRYSYVWNTPTTATDPSGFAGSDWDLTGIPYNQPASTPSMPARNPLYDDPFCNTCYDSPAYHTPVRFPTLSPITRPTAPPPQPGKIIQYPPQSSQVSPMLAGLGIGSGTLGFGDSGTGKGIIKATNSGGDTIGPKPSNFFTDNFLGRMASNIVQPTAMFTPNNVNFLSGNIENFSGDKTAEAWIGILTLGIGGEARAEATAAKELAPGLVTVGRWMSKEEHELMLSTNKVQESLSSTTHVANPADPEAFIKQAAPGSRYIEFNVPETSVKSTGNVWAKIIGPNSLEGRLAEKKGLNPIEMPSAADIRWIASKLSN